VIGAYYYFRIVKLMYFDEPAASFDAGIGAPLGSIMAGASVFNLFFVLFAYPLVSAAAVGAKALVP
jgi:NADH-quinone oxidoreductase subunit N